MIRQCWDKGSSFLERLINNPNCIPGEYRVPSSKGGGRVHGSYLLHRSESLLVSAEVWGPGDHVDPHDHHVWGMIGVLDNTLNEIRFRWHSDEDRPGFGRLEKDRDAVSKAGEVSSARPGHRRNTPDRQPRFPAHGGNPRLRPGPEQHRAVPLRYGDRCQSRLPEQIQVRQRIAGLPYLHILNARDA